MASSANWKTLRKLISEIRKYNPTTKPKESPILQYVLAEFRKNEVTDRKLCRGELELKHLAQTYLCYLTSQRKYQDLYSEYHGKNERSIQEAANLVGLQLPQQGEHEKP